jgi:serine/threonine-protein kinase
VVIAAITGASRGASWGSDDTIIFATSDPATGLLRVSARGGEPEVLTTPDESRGEEDHHFPSLLPGGRGLLFTIASREQRDRGVAVLDLRSGQWKTVLPSGSQAEYVATGRLVYQDGGALWAVAFDTATLDVVGDPAPVLEGVTRRSAAANFSISPHGLLVYAATSGPSAARSLVWVDRRGNEEPIAAPLREYLQPRISPDGTRIGVAIPGGRWPGFWIWDFSLRTLTPRPFGDVGTFAVWTRNGRHLILNAVMAGGNETNLLRRAADGTGAGEMLTRGGRPQRPMQISPDGRLVVFEQQTPEFSYDLMVLSLDDPGISSGQGARTSPLLATPADERNASIAPDGRWIAYESNKSGRFQIYVKPFPNVDDAEHQVSTEGGRTPVWSPSGRELFFVTGSRLMAVPVETVPAFRASTPAALFEAEERILDMRLLNNTSRAFDVSSDGQRFLMLKDTAADRASRRGIVVVQNWFQELLSRVRPAS